MTKNAYSRANSETRVALVTGGAGFIGSHLVERLLADGHTVRVLDNLVTGRLANIAHLKNNPRLSVHQAEVSDLGVIRYLFDGVHWVFHLAALADIVPSIQRPIDYHIANVDGTLATIEAARLAGVQRLVYAASASCYGVPDEYPTPETAAIRPQYPYALTKYVGEQYALHWSQVYGVPTISLRLFNVFGPRSRTSGTYGAVFGTFLAQKRAGKPFTVVGDGNQTRDFTFVTDVSDAFVRAAAADVTGESINIGTGDPQSVNNLVALLGGEVVHVPKRPGEPDRTAADIRKAERLLGWTPAVTFQTGVKVLLDNIDYWRSAPVWTPEGISEATKDWFAYLGPKESVGASEERS